MLRLAVVVTTTLYRQALCELLRAEARYEVVGEFNANTVDAFEVGSLRPDVILLDAGISQSANFCQLVRAVVPTTRIVLLGVGTELEPLVRWVEAGVDGFVTQDEHIDSLTTVIEVAARGDFVFPRKLVGKLVGHYVGMPWRPSSAPLTERETQVVTLLERGCSNKEIAQQLGIEVATTKNHVHNILEKLHIRRRSEVAGVLRRSTLTTHTSSALLTRPH